MGGAGQQQRHHSLPVAVEGPGPRRLALSFGRLGDAVRSERHDADLEHRDAGFAGPALPRAGDQRRRGRPLVGRGRADVGRPAGAGVDYRRRVQPDPDGAVVGTPVGQCDHEVPVADQEQRDEFLEMAGGRFAAGVEHSVDGQVVERYDRGGSDPALSCPGGQCSWRRGVVFPCRAHFRVASAAFSVAACGAGHPELQQSSVREEGEHALPGRDGRHASVQVPPVGSSSRGFLQRGDEGGQRQVADGEPKHHLEDHLHGDRQHRRNGLRHVHRNGRAAVTTLRGVFRLRSLDSRSGPGGVQGIESSFRAPPTRFQPVLPESPVRL